MYTHFYLAIIMSVVSLKLSIRQFCVGKYKNRKQKGTRFLTEVAQRACDKKISTRYTEMQ